MLPYSKFKASAVTGDKPKRTRPTSIRYAVALGFVLLALGIGSALEPLLGYRFPLIFFVAASVGAGWFGGFGPGLLALAAGFLVGDFFFVPPLHRFGTYTASDGALLLAYSGVTAIGLAAINNLHHVRQREEQIRQLNEELERRVRERTAELEAFCYSVSHDLRAPLRSIASFSQSLKDDYAACIDEAGRNMLGIVIESAIKMDKLLNGLLALSRLSRQEMHWQTVNLSALAQSIAESLKKSEPQRNVTFKIEPNLIVQGDEMLLRIALENLLNNAWKFTGKHREAVVEFGSKEREGEPAYFVRDNGAGFEMAHSEKLFGVFERMHSDAEFPGTGIGLAIVLRIITRHRGQIWAKAKPNQGATFCFTLPDQPNTMRQEA